MKWLKVVKRLYWYWVSIGVIIIGTELLVIQKVENKIGLFILLMGSIGFVVSTFLRLKYLTGKLNANPFNPFSVLDVDTNSKV